MNTCLTHKHQQRQQRLFAQESLGLCMQQVLGQSLHRILRKAQQQADALLCCAVLCDLCRCCKTSMADS
jgi:hypothetical protein